MKKTAELCSVALLNVHIEISFRVLTIIVLYNCNFFFVSGESF